ncbi:MAG TPA: hypothetical protein PLX35_11965 [Cyclobacteriaceae bacterium]|nr:hypothetical protein [Cyclobacteriaceae bacterium]
MIEEAGFDNLIPKLPLYEIGFSKVTWKRLLSDEFKRDYGGLLGFVYRLLKSLPYRSAPFTNEVWDADHASAITGLLNYNFVTAQVNAYIEVIRKSGADIVIDFWNPFVCIACRVEKKRLITVNQGDALPGSNGFIWWKEKPRAVPTVIPNLNSVLESYKLTAVQQIEELYVGHLSLVTGMPETDPLHDQQNFQYIGPLLWEKLSIKTPLWFHDLPKTTPIVWLYPGNPNYGGRSKIFDSESMLIACFKALAKENVCVVLTMGHHSLPKSIGDIPPNFRMVSFVPGLAMAKYCNLIIHHGGYGSCQTGLVAGVPSLILPTFSERESNARRIAKMGAGEFVIPKLGKNGRIFFDPKEIQAKANKIIGDPNYTEKALINSQKLKDYGGVNRAVDLIEAFTNKEKSSPIT